MEVPSMFLNIIVGFIVPWVVCLIIIREHKLIYFIAPFAGVISFIIDDFGFHYFWRLYPFELRNLSGIPFNIGLYCICPCILIQLIRKYNISVYIVLPLMSLMLTLIEGCGLLVGRVVYFNYWNIFATYISYFVSLLISYIFYKIIKKQNLII
jgi:hypothetical protein